MIDEAAWAEIVRAADFIQNTMTVTKPTAMMLVIPPMSSCASKDSWRVP